MAGIDSFTPEKRQALVAVARICSVISLIFSGFMVVSFAKFPELRKLSFTLVALLAAADIGASIGYMFGAPGDHSALCYAQAVLIQFFPVSSWVLAASIALIMQQITLTYRMFDGEQSRKFTIRCLGVAVCVATLCTVLPATTHSYGSTGSWCWISIENEGTVDWGTIWRYVAFYIPLWIIIVYELVAYSLIYHRMRKVKSFFDHRRRHDHQRRNRSGSINGTNGGARKNSTAASAGGMSVTNGWDDVAPPSQQDTIGGDQEARLIKFNNRLAIYPIILMVCWVLPTINRVQNSLRPDDPHFGLFMAATITVRLQGLLNALVYGMNETVQGAWAGPLQRMGCHCCWWRSLNAGDALGDGDEVPPPSLFDDEDDSSFIQRIDNAVKGHDDGSGGGRGGGHGGNNATGVEIANQRGALGGRSAATLV